MSEQISSTLQNPARLGALEATALLDSPPEAAFDRLTALATKILRTPVSLVSLVDKDRQFFKGAVGLPQPWDEKRETPLSHSFCQHVVGSGQPLIVSDARTHPLLHDNLAIPDLGVVAYAGMPLTTSSGQTLGSFCAIDSRPHQWTEEEIEILHSLAASTITEIELRLAARELRDNYQRLQQLEALRDDLTNMIVHDLRTPLTSFLSGMQTLPILGDLNERQQQFLDLSVNGGEVLLNMITDLLDVSKMESGTFGLETTEINVEALVDSALQQVNSLAGGCSLTLTSTIAPNLPKLEADEDKLRRTLVNLLGNAIKFTPPNGSVTIAAGYTPETDAICFAVEDTGEGIPRESMESIFEKFGQVKTRQSGRRRSTGLGLTFCKLVVEAHKGRIWADSIPGQGSTFYFNLPRRQSTPPETESAPPASDALE